MARIGRRGFFNNRQLNIASPDTAHFMGNAFLPVVAVIPLRQHDGEPARPVVEPGARVREGQLIAVQGHENSANVYASVPGILREYRSVPLADQTIERAAVIELSGSFGVSASRAMPRNLENASRLNLLNLIEDFGLVRTFSGKNEPLAFLLRSFQRAKRLGWENDQGIVALRMYDYDPSCCADSFLAETCTEAVLEGALLVARILEAKRVCLLYKNKKAFLDSVLQEYELPEGLEVVEMPSSGVYPAGSELLCKEEALVAFGKDSGESKESVFCINPWTAFSVFNTLKFSRPVLQRPVLVAGSAVAFPHIVNVRIGTRIRELASVSIAECGGFKLEPLKIVVGGLVSGKALHDLDTPVDANTDAIYFCAKGEDSFYSIERCIHCGRCLRACPRCLDPIRLAAAVQGGKLTHEEGETLQNEVSKCIFCGVCSSLCPARIPLHHIINGTLGSAINSAADSGGGEN